MPQPVSGFSRLTLLNASDKRPIFLVDDVQVVKKPSTEELAGVQTNVVFLDSLAPGWSDCSWTRDGNSVFFINPPWVANAHSGNASIAAHMNAQGALALCTTTPFGPGAGQSGLSFWIRASSGLQNLSIVLSKTGSGGKQCDVPSAARCDQGDQAACALMDPSIPCYARQLFQLGPVSADGEWTHLVLPFNNLPQQYQTFDRITFYDPADQQVGFALDDVTLLQAAVADANAPGQDALITFVGPSMTPVLIPFIGKGSTDVLAGISDLQNSAGPPLPTTTQAKPASDPAATAADSPPASGPKPSPARPHPSAPSRLATGAILGVLLGSLVAVSGAVFAFWRGMRWRRARKASLPTTELPQGQRTSESLCVAQPVAEDRAWAVVDRRVSEWPAAHASASTMDKVGLATYQSPSVLTRSPHSAAPGFGLMSAPGSDPSSLGPAALGPSPDTTGTARSTLLRVLQSSRVPPETAAIAQRLLDNHMCREIDRNELAFDDDDLLGSGGFGTVYKGTWAGRPVALKVLYGVYGYEQRDYEDFLREVEILSKTEHSCIIKFLGACFDPPCSFVTELAEGGSLHSRIHGEGAEPLSYEELLRIAIDVADAMAYLHPKVVHRDLKPQNVLLTSEGRAKICDFGVSRLKDRTYLSTKHIHVGTIQYMAPELFNNESVSEKCDVYSFAVLLWEAYSGKKPYEGLEPVHVLLKMSHQDRHVIPASCPPALASIITRCWDEDPARRPSFRQVFAELSWELERVVGERGYGDPRQAGLASTSHTYAGRGTGGIGGLLAIPEDDGSCLDSASGGDGATPKSLGWKRRPTRGRCVSDPSGRSLEGGTETLVDLQRRSPTSSTRDMLLSCGGSLCEGGGVGPVRGTREVWGSRREALGAGGTATVGSRGSAAEVGAVELPRAVESCPAAQVAVPEMERGGGGVGDRGQDSSSLGRRSCRSGGA